MARSLDPVLQQVTSAFERSLQQPAEGLQVQEVGSVRYVGQGIARIDGLPGVQLEELVQFSGGGLGMVFNLEEHEIGVVLLSQNASLKAGSQAARTGRILDTPVGEALLGRVVDPLGRPLDGRPAPVAARRLPVERPAPSIMQRAPVTTPLQTGLKVIDATIPIGRGQRELILGDRQTGKSAIALDTIINQRDQGVVCVYCAIGQRGSSTARMIADLIHYQAMDYTIVVVAAGEDSPGLQFVAPYAATTMAEYFMEQGQDVLVVYDDLTNHARSYRELSLLLRRPPGREAFPGDIFYIHSRLLERATQMKEEFGGGSLSALPIVETEAQNVSAYIPTNLISITDGQIYLSPDLFQKGVLPAVDVGQSVSRVGGKTQLAAYREVAGALRLSYSQFEELEAFSRFGTRLDEETQKIIEHGQRVREALKQPQYHPMPVAEQIAALLSVTEGLLDEAPIEQVAALEMRIRHAVTDNLPDLSARIQAGEILGEAQRKALLETAQEAIEFFQAEQAHGND